MIWPWCSMACEKNALCTQKRQKLRSLFIDSLGQGFHMAREIMIKLYNVSSAADNEQHDKTWFSLCSVSVTHSLCETYYFIHNGYQVMIIVAVMAIAMAIWW